MQYTQRLRPKCWYAGTICWISLNCSMPHVLLLRMPSRARRVARRQLVIVPGLGDRLQLYGLFRPLWALLGYDVHIIVFGWEYTGVSFAAAHRRFLKRIDALPGEVDIIGVSAG